MIPSRAVSAGLALMLLLASCAPSPAMPAPQAPTESAVTTRHDILPAEVATLAPSVAVATATSQPTATASPPVLLVERAAYEQWQHFWPLLPQHLACRVNMVDERLASDVASTADLYIHASWAAGADELVLRHEPYVWCGHLDNGLDQLTWDTLGALVAEGWTIIAAPPGQALVEQQAVEMAPKLVLLEAAEAVRLAATTRCTLALVPWDAVDVCVRVYAWEGHNLDVEHLAIWPLQHRLLADVRTGVVAPELVAALSPLSYAPPKSLSLVAVGDIMLARNVGESIRTQGAHYPLAAPGVQALLADADIAFGNLECAVSERGERQAKTYTFRADPVALQGLLWAGVDVVSLANNHTCDYGPVALLDTIEHLEAAGIRAVGAGEHLARARAAQIVERKGLRVAFLAYNQIGPRWMDAQAQRSGSAYLDEAMMLDDIREAATVADLVIVSCHWGTEHASQASAWQQALANRLMEAGAVLVLGHHPHVVQGLGLTERRLVAYSLGNFVFDMSTPGSRDGVALRCLLDSAGVKQAELVPYHINAYQPCLLAGDQADAALRHAHALTSQLEGWPQ